MAGRRRTYSSCWAMLWLCLLGLLGCTGHGCNREEETRPDPGEASDSPAAQPAVTAPVAAVTTSETWLDLLAQRPNAVLLRDEAVWIDLGQENARKHLALVERDGWLLARPFDGRSVGVVTGRSGSLDIPLDGPLAPGLHPDTAEHAGLAVGIELRALAAEQTMTVLWNDRPLAHLQIPQTWERRTLSLPAEVVRPGENRLRLHFRKTGTFDGTHAAAVVSRIEVGTHARITEVPSAVAVSPEAKADDPRLAPVYQTIPEPSGDTALRLPGGSGFAWYVQPPRRGKLVLQAKGRGALSVLVSTDEHHREGKPPVPLLEEPLRQTGRRAELDLSAWGDVPIRLSIVVSGQGADTQAVIERAQVVARRSIPIDRRSRGPRDIVVLTVEGARADALDDTRRPSLPALEALMANAVVFERAYAPSPTAVPSHAAWLTSVVPPAHLTVSGTFVADARMTLAEALGRADYARVFVSANTDVNEERGLLQGFDVRQVLAGLTDDVGSLLVVREAMAAAEKKDGPRFVYANVNDPQAPYEPPRDVLDDLVPLAGAPMPHLTHIWVGRVRLGKHEPTPKELQYVRRLYRGEMQMVDTALGELVERLRRQDRFDDAIVVVVGVHGEEFFEHGNAGHGRQLYEESLRVPLIIHAPALLQPGRVSDPVDLLDLAPTLADLVGLPPADEWQGRSLLPLVDDPDPPPALVVAYHGDGSRAAIADNFKYLLGPGRAERFFALGSDPGEQTEAAATAGIALRMVRSALSWQLAHEERWRRSRWGTGVNLTPAFALDLGM